MQTIAIATRNKGKYKELAEALCGLPFKFISLDEAGIKEDVEETGDTYEANAILKAEYFGQKLLLPTIADDSGIVVEALQGELGVKTRRFGAGEKASDEKWLEFFLTRMANEKNRRACFISVIALYRPDQKIIIFQGQCQGIILERAAVALEIGIPLSSVFLPDGKDMVLSAMPIAEKNAISHRGQAIEKCIKYLRMQ